jgi:hypothetical protein
MPPCSSVSDWLAGIKMDRYAEQFVGAGIATMDDVAHLTLKDLVNLGVTLVGHQKKIMNSVQTLRAQQQQAVELTSTDTDVNERSSTSVECLA